MSRPAWAAFDTAEHLERVAQARALFGSVGAEVLVATDPETLYHLGGLDTYTFYAQQFLVLGSESGAEVLIVRDVDADLARSCSWVADIRTYQLGSRDPFNLLSEVLAEVAPAPAAIAVELESPATSSVLARRLVDSVAAPVVDAAHMLRTQRAVKSPAELEYLRGAGRLLDLGLGALSAVLRPGISEHEVVASVESAQRAAGSEYAPLPFMLGSGPRSRYGHATPVDRVLEDGDVLGFSFAGVKRRYSVYAYRTAVVGRPAPVVTELYARVLDVHHEIIAAIRPGALSREVADVAAKAMRACDLDDFVKHRFGFGGGLGFPPCGLALPELSPTSDETLVEGMTFSVLITPVWTDQFGLMLGAEYVLEADGLVALSRADLGLLASG